jgi:hypothetical protein
MSKKGSVSKIPDDCLPHCATCAFFESDKKTELGECHRYPPTLLPEEEGRLSFSFALTASDEWCGEFVRYVS